MNRSISAVSSGIRSLTYAIVLASAVSFFALAPVPAQAVTYPNFTFSGAGYGHGIGLSQYGAKGYAEAGMSGTWIVGHYFPGTTLVTPAAKIVKVNLDPAATSTNGFTQTRWVVQAGWAGMGVSLNDAASLPDTAGPFTFAALSSNRVAVTDKNNRAVAGSPFSGTVKVTMKGSASPKLLLIDGRSGPFKTSSVTPSTDVRYRGALLISSNGSKLKLLNELPMESYLNGVVPRESPASWHMEALKAQAIVARSYAYAGRSEMYCDTRSQMYNGYSHGTRGTDPDKMHENSRTNLAVRETANKCVAYSGTVVSTYFSSSSGGYTANKVDVWGGSEIPYLRGVPDPLGKGSFDPWATPVKLNGLQLAAKIAPRVSGEPAGAGSSVYINRVSVEHTWPTGFARTVTVRWSDSRATTTVITADHWRQWLGLRSTKFFSNAQGSSRIGANPRYSRSVAASKMAFPSTAKRVIVVNADGDLYVDAVLGSALSGVAQAPVLFVHHDSVPSEVTAEIKRLHASKVYVIGGTSVVSSDVYNKLKGIVPAIQRIQGTDRYATSAAVAREARKLGATSGSAVIASGTSWRDAAAAAAMAGGSKRPLLLTTPTKLSGAAASVLKEFKTTRTYIVGNTSAVSNATVASVRAITRESAPRRIGATGTSYDLAVEVAKYETASLGFSASTVYTPSAYSMSDVLIGSGLSSATKHPYVLASTYTPPAATRTYLSANHSPIRNVTVIGTPTTVGLAVGMRLMSDAY